MKNTFAAACLLAGLSTGPTWAAPADEPAPTYTPATVARAQTLTRALAQRIPLDEAQYVRVRQLHLQMLTERKDLELRLSSAEPAVRDQQLADAQQRYETALAALLRPTQLLAYQHLRSNFTAHRL